MLDRQVAPIRFVQDIDLIDRSAEDVGAAVAGQLQKTVVRPNEAQVVEPTDRRGRGVRAETTLETLFGLHFLGEVGNDQDETGRMPVFTLKNEAADAVNPMRLLRARLADFDDDIVHRLTRDDPFDRRPGRDEPIVVAVGKREATAIRVDVDAELGDRRRAVKRKCCGVRPPDRLVRIDEDDPLAQSGDDLVELGRLGGRNRLRAARALTRAADDIARRRLEPRARALRTRGQRRPWMTSANR